MAVIKAVSRDLMPLPFWNTALAMALLLIAGVAFAFLLMRAAARPEGTKPAVTLFLVIFMTLPLTAFMLMWGEVAIAFALGFVLAAIAANFAWLWAAEGWGLTTALAAAAMALLSVTTYQAQLFVAVAGVLAANIAFELRAERRVFRLRDQVGISVRLAGPIIAGGALGVALSLGLIWNTQDDSSYHAQFLAWGSVDLSKILDDLIKQISDYATGNGFFGGWVLIPSLLVGATLLLQLVAQAIRGSSWWPVALLVALLLAPFGASIALGTALPQRAMHAMPLVVGAVWLLWALAFRRSNLRTAVFVVAMVALTVWHSGVTSHLYYVEVTTFETDRLIASAIVERLASQGWDGSRLPIVSVGTRPRALLEDIDQGDAFGLSFFNELHGGIRTVAFMQAMGHPFEFPSFEQRADALIRADSMPDWPARGAVTLHNGVAIVRFAEPALS